MPFDVFVVQPGALCGWMDGMVIMVHRSSKSTFSANNDKNIKKKCTKSHMKNNE